MRGRAQRQKAADAVYTTFTTENMSLCSSSSCVNSLLNGVLIRMGHMPNVRKIGAFVISLHIAHYANYDSHVSHLFHLLGNAQQPV